MSSATRSAVLVLLLVAGAGSAVAQEASPQPQSLTTPPVTVTPPPTEAERAAAAKAAAAPPEALPKPHTPIAAWVNGEGFRIKSPDGNWSLRVGLQAAFSYQPIFRDGANNWSNFVLNYVRPRINGTLFRPWFQYWCSFEFKQFPPFLLDCYVEPKPWSFFGLRAGQFWTPLSRHEYLGPQEIVFVDWDVAADYFWTGRDRGAQVFGETDYVDYYLMFSAGTTLTQTTTVPGNFQLIGRVSVNPLGKMGATEMPYVASTKPVPFRLSFTAQGAYGRVNPNGVGFNSDAFLQLNQQGERKYGTASADLLVQWERFGFFGEFYWRRVEPLDMLTPKFNQYGAWAQAHVTFFRRILDFAIRFTWINPSNNLPNDRFLAGEAQLAWFIFGPALALRLRYGVGNQQNPGPAPAANPDLLTTVGLPIAPGTAHVVTLQIQLAL
jgi:hypothetical protein